MDSVYGTNYTYADIYIGEYNITNADIVQGGLTINSYSSNGENLEVGTAISSEMSLTLENADGRWDNVEFIGKDCGVRAYCFPSSNDVASTLEGEWTNVSGTIYVTSTRITVDAPSWSMSPINLGTLTCNDSGDEWEIGEGLYKASAGISGVASLKVTILNRSSTEVETRTLNGDEWEFETVEGFSYRLDVVLLQELTRGTYDVDFSFRKSREVTNLGLFTIDECTYSRDRVTLRGLDYLNKWDTEPIALQDYSQPGFQLKSNGAIVRSKPIPSSTYRIGTTSSSYGNYSIVEVENNDDGLWFRISPNNSIDVPGGTMLAGDNAWLSAQATTGTLYPDTTDLGFEFPYQTPFVPLGNLIRMEINLHDELISLDSNALAAMNTITVNHFKLGNSFTMRQLLAYAAGLLGKCAKAYATDSQMLCVGLFWYDMTENFLSIGKSEAYEYIYQPKDLSVTGVTLTSNGTTYAEGNSDYVLNLGDNALTNAISQITVEDSEVTFQEYVRYKYMEFTGTLRYWPMEATVVQYPIDATFSVAQYNPRTGYRWYSPITDWTWTLNGATKLRSRGSYLKALPSSSGGSGGGGSSGGGVTSYTNLLDKPQINRITLTGDKSFEDLGLHALTYAEIDALLPMDATIVPGGLTYTIVSEW